MGDAMSSDDITDDLEYHYAQGISLCKFLVTLRIFVAGEARCFKFGTHIECHGECYSYVLLGQSFGSNFYLKIKSSTYEP